MATYLSDSIRDRAYISTSHEHGEAVRSVAATITVPNGTALAANDILKFFRLEAGHTIVSARAIVSSALASTATIDLGYYQVTDTDGNVVRSSPSTSANGIQDGNTTLNTAGIKSFTVASLLPVAGPVDIALTVDAINTAVSNTVRSITLIIEVVRQARVQSDTRLDRGGY